MSATRTTGAAWLALFLIGAGFHPKAQALPAEVQSQVDAGKGVFAASCAVCHGADGGGALGPALRERNLGLDLIRRTIADGRVGSVMPAFRETLSAEAFAQVVAYVQWLSSAGSLPQRLISAETSAREGTPSSEAVAVGRDHGIPARGAALFFDATATCSCRSCHSHAHRGGPVGPDLINLNQPPAAVRQEILSPAPAPPGFEAESIVLRDGSVMLGIKSTEDATAISLFDVSSCPPVKRTVPRSEVAQVSRIVDHALYDHAALSLSKQDWADLSAYLGVNSASGR